MRFRRQHPAQPRPERFEVVAVGITPGGSWVLTDGRPETLAITDGRLPEVSGNRAPSWRCPPIHCAVVNCCRSARAARCWKRSTWCSPFCTARTARTEPSRAARTRRRAVCRCGCAGQRRGHGQGVHQAARCRGPADRRPRRATPPRHRRTRGPRAAGAAGLRQARARSSSIGVSRVTAWDQLSAAIELARRHDPKVIVEAAVPGRELECGVEFPDGRVGQHRRRDPGRRSARSRGRVLRLRDQISRGCRRTRRARQGRRRRRR